MRSSDELVRSLVADLTPVRRLRSAGVRAALWGGMAIAWVSVGAYALGTRPDLARRLGDAAYLAEAVALAIVFAASAWSAFRLSIPGAEPRWLARLVPAAAMLAWTILVVHRWSPGAPGIPGSADEAVAWRNGIRCVERMLVLSIAPTVAMFLLLRSAVPRARAWIGCLAVLSASALAIVGTQVVCPRDGAGHILAWHAVPLVTIAALGLALGRGCLAARTGTPRATASARCSSRSASAGPPKMS